MKQQKGLIKKTSLEVVVYFNLFEKMEGHSASSQIFQIQGG
jgi:hypothetical protein